MHTKPRHMYSQPQPCAQTKRVEAEASTDVNQRNCTHLHAYDQQKVQVREGALKLQAASDTSKCQLNGFLKP